MTDAMFADVVGQDAACRSLRAHIARTGGSGSILLAGPSGTGRAFLARRLAHALLGEPALIDAGRHPDYTELVSSDGIAGVREATRRLQRKPSRAPRQMLLVRGADHLSTDALNALLKTLEEPPADAAIVLTARSPHDLLETVVSRCKTVRLTALTNEETRTVLQRHGVANEAAAKLAEDAGGAPGRALYYHEANLIEDADALLHVMQGPTSDPLAVTEKLVRRRKDEDGKAIRHRLGETLRIVARRLQANAATHESALRQVIESLRSLDANANPSIVLADLALHAWKHLTTPPPDPARQARR